MKIFRQNDVYTPWSAGFIGFTLFILILTIPLGIIYGIVRNLIERSENQKLGKDFVLIEITREGYRIFDKGVTTLIPLNDVVEVSGYKKFETSLSGLRQATTTYPFGKLKIKTVDRTISIKNVALISEVVFFLNYIIKNPDQLELLLNSDGDETTSLMYTVFLSKLKYSRQHYFGKKAQLEDDVYESDFKEKIKAVLVKQKKEPVEKAGNKRKVIKSKTA